MLSDAPQNHGTQQKGIHIQNCKVWVLKLPIPAISDPSGEAPRLKPWLIHGGACAQLRSAVYKIILEEQKIIPILMNQLQADFL